MTSANVFVAHATPDASNETDWRTEEHVPTSDREGLVVALLLGVLVLAYMTCIVAMLAALPKDGASLEERGERDLVGDGKGGERGERHVHSAVLDHAEVLRVQSHDLGSLFLGQLALFPELSKAETETTLRRRDRLLESRAKLHLRTTVIPRRTLASRHKSKLG